MCQTCGCSTGHRHHHHHDHAHGPAHDHGHGHSHHRPHHDHGTEDRAIAINRSLLAQNDRLAERNRGMFAAHGIVALNLVSSPGSGKTAILERTLAAKCGLRMAVIVGDLATENDANRLRRHGAPALQIQTGTVCHLDAHMIHHALDELPLRELDIVFIENVGNLVCPAAFDLGEDARVVVTSVTEGEDKPQKYPSIFQGVTAILLNKIDLAEACGFDRDTALEILREAAPGADVLEISARTGVGFDLWLSQLRAMVERKKSARRT